MPERIQRQRTKGWRMPANAVYVGRPTKWGNPWSLADVGYVYYDVPVKERRAAAVELYHRDIENWAHFVSYLDDRAARGAPDINDGFWAAIEASGARHVGDAARIELRGKDLACWCPVVDAEGNRVPCHADVLLEWANVPEVGR